MALFFNALLRTLAKDMQEMQKHTCSPSKLEDKSYGEC